MPLEWAEGERPPSQEELRATLAADGIVAEVVRRFQATIGRWR